MRYFIEVSYHGQAYHGWQIQPNAHTVQAEIQSALLKLTGQSLEILASGRTDTGVHARQQFFHLDIPLLTDPQGFLYKLNGVLPDDIALLNIAEVIEGAHARFDALSRSYEYHITQRKNPFGRDLSYYFTPELDLHEMNRACQDIIGKRNFQSLSKVKTSVNNFECEITAAAWRRNNEKLIFYVSANRFLRGMVRALVGTLLQVGMGKMTLLEFRTVLESRDRRSAGPAVPAQGLILSGVKYPDTVFKGNS